MLDKIEEIKNDLGVENITKYYMDAYIEILQDTRSRYGENPEAITMARAKHKRALKRSNIFYVIYSIYKIYKPRGSYKPYSYIRGMGAENFELYQDKDQKHAQLKELLFEFIDFEAIYEQAEKCPVAVAVPRCKLRDTLKAEDLIALGFTVDKRSNVFYYRDKFNHVRLTECFRGPLALYRYANYQSRGAEKFNCEEYENHRAMVNTLLDSGNATIYCRKPYTTSSKLNLF